MFVAFVLILTVLFRQTLSTCDCGLPNPKIPMIGDTSSETKPVFPHESIPWHVTIKKEAKQIECSGVIISEGYVLTDSLCFWISDEVQVYAEYKDMKFLQNVVGTVVMKEIGANVIKLSENLNLNENVMSACLPSDPVQSFIGKKGIVSHIFENQILYKDYVTIISNNDPKCDRSTNNICARTSTCYKSKGHPLVTLHNGKWTLVGINWENGCDNSNKDTAFGSIPKIANTLRDELKLDDSCSHVKNHPVVPKCDLNCLFHGLNSTLKDDKFSLFCKNGYCKIQNSTFDICDPKLCIIV
ncbi:chymotrypsinogen A [Lepeophtheirus salmonis]|uniref:chymotrypsinogen A n=1 Tax=Lepeophtheirus salmonis TaxID=72036 RepID=UPI00077F195D|nr:vitamin K-dependent protein Z-like [Lepeophtheirus salmonis]